MKPILFMILNLFSLASFSQEFSKTNLSSNIKYTSNNIEFQTRSYDEEFNIALEGNSDLNLCYGDLAGRIAWIPPGISGGTPYNGLEDINTAILNGEIDEGTPYIDPSSTDNYYLGPFIYLDNNNCDGIYDGTENLVLDITSLAAGCYVVFVIDAEGNQSEVTSITISEPNEIMNLIPLINNECDNQENGSIQVEIDGGSPFSIGEEDYIYTWTGPNNFTANTQNISELEAGVYTLLVKDSNDCSQSFDFTVESVICAASQIVDLTQGWSIISTYIDPYNNDIESVFNSALNNLEIIKDENGNVYWPLFGLNSIGNLIIGEGYQVKMNFFDQIIITGDIVPYNTPILFNEGWNLIGYLHPEPGDAIEMMDSIVNNQGPLKILKNGNGDVYWPEFELNSIGNMIPGKGYQIKLESSVEFSYPPILARYGYQSDNRPIHFKEIKKTDQNMIIGIPKNAWKKTPNFGDEIGAFDATGKLIGSAVYSHSNLSITIWGDDNTTNEKDGAIEGENITFVLWESNSNTEKILDFKWEKGSEYYAKNGINVAKKITILTFNHLNQLYSISDLLGRSVTTETKNQILFYIYKNSEVKKRYFFK